MSERETERERAVNLVGRRRRDKKSCTCLQAKFITAKRLLNLSPLGEKRDIKTQLQFSADQPADKPADQPADRLTGLTSPFPKQTTRAGHIITSQLITTNLQEFGARRG